jgi:uncharacterized protein with PQ loop repeat
MFGIGIKGLQLFSGSLSSILFMVGTLPMVVKAFKTRNLKSYSLGNILLSNFGNFIYWIYQVSLPFGPTWFLHSFNTITTFLMLILYLRHEKGCTPSNLPKCFLKPTLNCVGSGAV